MSDPINWEEAQNDPSLSDAANKLKFYKTDGSIASEKETGDTHQLEYISGMRLSEDEVNPKYADKKGRPTIKFTFMDLEEKIEKTAFKNGGSRFVNAFLDAKPNPGDKIQIKRFGGNTTFDINYAVVKLDAATAPAPAEAPL